MERFRDSAKGDHASDNDFKWYQMFLPKFMSGSKGGKL
jgi:hypothetical protein